MEYLVLLLVHLILEVGLEQIGDSNGFVVEALVPIACISAAQVLEAGVKVGLWRRRSLYLLLWNSRSLWPPNAMHLRLVILLRL